MTKTKIEIIVTAGFVVLFAFVVFKSIPGAKVKKATPPAPVKNSPAVAHKRDVVQADTNGPAKAAAWGRDPFSFGKSTYASAENGMVLNGIVWDENAPSAIINDNIVKVGEEVDGKKVAEIKKDKVILTKDGAVYELNLGSDGSL
ncbi:MAG: hypothetical protein NTV07_02310 [Candidatus Omnitrophica bacterium]|nr:hypothetical protein [Candidatus Omnitrophota bacterium]